MKEAEVGKSESQLLLVKLHLLTHHRSKLSVQDVEPVDLSRVSEHLLQLVKSRKILPTRSGVVVVSSLSVGERLEDGERRLGVAQAEPGSRPGLEFNAGVNVPHEGSDGVLLALLGLELD